MGSGRFYIVCRSIGRSNLCHGSRFACLGNGERAGPSWEERQGDASEDEAREHGDRQDIVLDSLMSPYVSYAKHNMLDLVVDSSTYLKRGGLRVRGEVVKVSLKQPKRLVLVSADGMI